MKPYTSLVHSHTLIMTVDLSQFLYRTVEVTHRDGSIETGRIYENNEDWYQKSHPYRFGLYDFSYTKSGRFSDNVCLDSLHDIMKIRLIETKYAHLEQQVAEIQAEIERLKEQENLQLPENFNRKYALKLLDGNMSYHFINRAFFWESTPQGHDYWEGIAENETTLPEDAIKYIQEMVILSYHQQYGD